MGLATPIVTCNWLTGLEAVPQVGKIHLSQNIILKYLTLQDHVGWFLNIEIKIFTIFNDYLIILSIIYMFYTYIFFQGVRMYINQ